MRLAHCTVLLLTSGFAMATPPVERKTGFEPYPGARNLCSEHVTANAMHLRWTSWATKDDVKAVVAHYEKATGQKAGTGERGERTFTDGKDLRLSVYPASKHDEFPKCDQRPTADEKVVVLISQAIR
ncbi:MAG: hypothetical protein JNJ54_20800 [Myxococcaceae bacterium]|nr:hypothetical protein [Myxococcaceae bacterium]